MKVCFAVDGTAISEGAFDCKFPQNLNCVGIRTGLVFSKPTKFFIPIHGPGYGSLHGTKQHQCNNLYSVYYDNIHKKSNTLVFCHVAKMLDFCSMSEESMSKINPQTILDALQSAEEDAKKVEKKFMEKMNTYEDVNVSDFLNAPGPGLLMVF